MREYVRPVATALGIACLAASMAIVSATGALAQAKQAPPKQMAPAPAKQAAPAQEQEAPLKQIALTEKQIQGVLSAAKEMDPITEKLPDDGKPDPKIIAQLEGVAKKNGFASYDEYNSRRREHQHGARRLRSRRPRNMSAPQPSSRRRSPRSRRTRKCRPRTRRKCSPTSTTPEVPGAAIEHKGNIDLVAKYYDKLAEALGEEQQ